MALPFMKSSNDDLVVYVNKRTYNIPSDHENYEEIKDAIARSDVEEFISLADKVTKLYESLTSRLPNGEVEVRGSNVFYNGVVITNVLADRIVEYAEKKLPVEGLKAFLSNLMQNPSRRAVQELYKFLEHKGLPITEDGCFYAYKAVTENFLDKHSKTIDNSVGNVVEIPRNQVDDEHTRDCSYGLHVGTMKYVENFAFGNDKILLVKVNPKDCVTVPQYDSTKMRVCRYEVIQEFGYNEALQAPLYSASGPTPVDAQDDYWTNLNNDDDEDWDDYPEECPYCQELDCEEVDCREEVDLSECQDPHCPTCLEEQKATDERKEELMEYLTRDSAVEEAKKRGLIATKEAGRKMGKEAVCLLLAREDVKHFVF